MNRSRLRRMLCHLVLDWDSVQFDVRYFAVIQGKQLIVNRLKLMMLSSANTPTSNR